VHCGQTVQAYSYYGTLIGNPTPGIQWYKFQPPGVTPNRGMVPLWGAFCQITLTTYYYSGIPHCVAWTNPLTWLTLLCVYSMTVQRVDKCRWSNMSLQYFEHVIVICRSYSAKKHLHVILNRNVKTCLFGNRFWACNMLPKYTYTTLSYDTILRLYSHRETNQALLSTFCNVITPANNMLSGRIMCYFPWLNLPHFSVVKTFRKIWYCTRYQVLYSQ